MIGDEFLEQMRHFKLIIKDAVLRNSGFITVQKRYKEMSICKAFSCPDA